MTSPVQFRNVSEYIAAQPATSRPLLRRVRATIRKALPRAKEEIHFDMPAYRLPRGGLVHFAGWTKQWSMYGVTPALVAELGDALAPYDVEKGTIRFSLKEPVPVELVTRFVKFAAREADAEAALATYRRMFHEEP